MPRAEAAGHAIAKAGRCAGNDEAAEWDEPDEVRAGNWNRGPRRLSPVLPIAGGRRVTRTVRDAGAYVAVLWRHSKAILTGSGLAVGILVYEHLAGTLSQFPFWLVILAAFFWASFRAWQHEKASANELRTRVRADAPTVIAQYDAPGIPRNPETLQLHNTSLTPAYNVQLEALEVAGCRVEFPRVPYLPAGAVFLLDVRTTSESPAHLNRLHDILMHGRGELGLVEWAEPVAFLLLVRYTDAGGRRFESRAQLKYTPTMRTSDVEHVSVRLEGQ